MKRVLLGVLATSVAVTTAVLAAQTSPPQKAPAPKTAAKPQHKAAPSEPPPDHADLHLQLVKGVCTLMEQPGPIWVRPDHKATWSIKGSCNEKDRITVGRFRPNGKPFHDVTTVPPIEGQTITLEALKDHPGGKQPWTYKVLLNHNPIALGYTPLDRGDFDLYCCPDWPCDQSVKGR